ncbi:uncharacterized protein C2845_PM11G00640 [Panicum miliaceum]|uniref:KIB1-4 beta-propeller domain-containing protein n=1 Tax=Panicum miliaceum TaxID=4540 RepID=A0A3L6RQW3_PANMI|nr:uncharacterized protein C2845_PM11G00640 [Panicum miliaceum]
MRAAAAPPRRIFGALRDERLRALGDERDWANLTCCLVEDIAGRLLSHDVAEYYRFRAVCRPWRDHTADPRARGALDSRFRPRNWAVLTITQDPGPRRLLLNIATAASLSVNLRALTTHCHLCAVDGFLVLFHMRTDAVCLLDPLSNAVTEFPALSSSSTIVATVPTVAAQHFFTFFRRPGGIRGHTINGACLDESTSPPTLVLGLRNNLHKIIFAKPGDAHWTLVNQSQAYYSDDRGRVVFHSLLSHGGRCYVASLEGSIFLVELGPLPQLVEIVNQAQRVNAAAVGCVRILSYLVGGSDGRMLMVRYWTNVEHFGGRRAYSKMELFTVGSVTGRIEVLEVDIAGRTLVPVRSGGLGHYAAFIGMTHCMLISTKTFPSIVANAIYLGCFYQSCHKFSIYRLESRRAEPPHEFNLDENETVVPRARPCNLDQYLVCYVDRRHKLSGPCINHVRH